MSRPTVILGHDLGSDSTTERYLRLAADYAVEPGFVTAVLDGPFHGCRRSPVLDHLRQHPPSPEGFEAVRAEMGRSGHAAHMAADWSELVNLLAGLPECDADRMAFEAVSMSSLLGVTFVAAEPRIRCAVFHAVGARVGAEAAGLGDEIGGDSFAERVAAIGPRPVLVMAQADDELFSRASSLRFYDLLSGPDKELTFLPGGHRVPPAGPPAHRRISASFLAAALAP